MLRNADSVHSVEKLRQILASRFQKSFELRQLIGLNATIPGERGFSLKGSDLYIPLNVKDAFLGTAVISGGASLDGEQHLQIAQIVRMVLEPTLYREYLERREGNLRILAESPELTTDNLSVFNEPALPGLDEAGGELKKPKLISNLLHLQAHDPQRLKKAALLLHEMTGRWAFVPYADLNHGLHSLEDILRLGALTIHIDGIENLPVYMQEVILEYVSSPRSQEDPLFVTSSPRTLDDLAEAPELLPAFRDEITTNALELDRSPLTEHGLREVLALMFFEAQGRA
ncbi:MAG: hypothetical protein KF865_07535 [Bdellovibrionaceae bacterium]|nr:hypothetical protein [Pseudobdellovibrionaceae bacterium]